MLPTVRFWPLTAGVGGREGGKEEAKKERKGRTTEGRKERKKRKERKGRRTEGRIEGFITICIVCSPEA